jgi:hypothetical protein
LETEIRELSGAIASGLGARGLLNLQLALQGGELFVLEANPRASRTVPFLAKATGIPLVDHACRLLLGAGLEELHLPARATPMRAWAKESVFPEERFANAADRGPEMHSTGEVMARRRTDPGPPPARHSGGELVEPVRPKDGSRSRDSCAAAEVERFDHAAEVLGVESPGNLPETGRLLRAPELGRQVDEEAFSARHRRGLPVEPIPVEVVLAYVRSRSRRNRRSGKDVTDRRVLGRLMRLLHVTPLLS